MIGHSQALLSAGHDNPHTLHAYIEVFSFNRTPGYNEFAQEYFIPWMKEKNGRVLDWVEGRE